MESSVDSTMVLSLQSSTGLPTSFRYWIDTGFRSAIQYWIADIIPLLNRHRFHVCNPVLRTLNRNDVGPVSESSTGKPTLERCRSDRHCRITLLGEFWNQRVFENGNIEVNFMMGTFHFRAFLHGKNRFFRSNKSTLVVLYLVIKPIWFLSCVLKNGSHIIHV